jgi:hypothetical protein
MRRSPARSQYGTNGFCRAGLAGSAEAISAPGDGSTTTVNGSVITSEAALNPDVYLCVPKTSSTSCGQAVFVDQATDASLSSDAVLSEIDRLG